jgi:hypothetical protein
MIPAMAPALTTTFRNVFTLKRRVVVARIVVKANIGAQALVEYAKCKAGL